MVYYYLLFFFVTVGAKLILALVMIYLLLPSDRHCGDCEGETLLMEGSRLVRISARLWPGRLQRRWCPRCGREGFARPTLRGHTPEPAPQTRTPTRS
jgi:hypothetical protein